MSSSMNSFAEMCGRFADGELPHDEQNLLLAACEQQPERYRELALAMVERRRMAELLEDFADVEQVTAVAPMPITKVGYASKERAAGSGVSTRSWLATLAASLLLGVVVGLGTARLEFGPSPQSTSSVAQQEVEDADDLAAAQESFADAQLRDDSFVAEADSAVNPFENQETLVSLARELKPNPTLDAQTVRLLNDSGVNVERHNHVFLFDISDGRRLAIPAEFTVLRSGSR